MKTFVVTQEQSTTSRRQPSRGAKSASTEAHADIPIQETHAAGEAEGSGQGRPPLMSTQDYLEEAEELLTHRLEPTELQTQPDAAPVVGFSLESTRQLI